MDVSEMNAMARDTLSEWLDGAYFEEDRETADWLERASSQKIVEMDAGEHDQVFMNKETGEKFQIQIAVYELTKED